MSFYVVIPARMASTRLPEKPLVDIAGKPMVVRVAERALLSGATRVIVATDDDRVITACQAHQVEAVMTRADHASGTDRIAEVANQMAWSDEAVIVNVQGDEPLIDPELIRATANLIDAQSMMATAAHPLENMDEIFNPNIVKVVLNAQGHALYFSRAPIPWDRDAWAKDDKQMPSMPVLRHIGLYAFRNAFLKRYANLSPSPIEKTESLEQLRVLWHGYAIAVHVSTSAPAPGIDTPADLEKVRALFA